MMEWLQQLDPRRRERVLLLALLLFLTVVTVVVWFSLATPRAQLQAQVEQRQATLAYINAVAPNVRALAASSVETGSYDGSLLAEIDASARASGLTDALSRAEPEGEHRVRVWLDNVSFDAVARWLESLNRAHGIIVREASVDRAAGAPGQVNMRLTIGRP